MRPARLLGEILIVPLAGLLAWLGFRVDAAGSVLVALTVAVAIVLGHLVRPAELTAWPALPFPERGGRRAEIYRLSWQLGSGGSASVSLLGRVRTLAATLEPDATPAERAAMAAALAPLERSQDPRHVAAAVAEIERTLAAIEQRTAHAPDPRRVTQRRPR